MTKDKFYEIVNYIKDIISETIFKNVTYVVGGAVRDIIMDKSPKDIDLCVELENGGIELGKYLFEQGLLVYEPVIYPTYGTCQFILKKFPDIELEAVQTRKEQYKDKNSRNPETCFGSLKQDIFRRDFTCNTLLYDISNQKILDLTGKGIEDIKDKILRCVGEI